MTPSCEAEKEDQRYFNSPPHKKNHIATTMINTVFFKISTHILTKRMTTIPTITFKAGTFQLTSSRRGWLYNQCLALYTTCISTHILTKRMTRTLHGNQQRIVISTHILTKRMTRYGVSDTKRNSISTHILTKRMTCALLYDRLTLKNFNSHPHEEDDLIPM